MLVLHLLAHVPEGLEGRLAEAGRTGGVGDVGLEVLHEVGPLLLGDLGARDLRDHLGAGVPDLADGAPEGLPHRRLDAAAGVGIDLEPFLLQLSLATLVARVERVLEDETREASRLGGLLLVRELGGEAGEETRGVLLLTLLQLLLGRLTRVRVGALRRLKDGGDVGHGVRTRGRCRGVCRVFSTAKKTKSRSERSRPVPAPERGLARVRRVECALGGRASEASLRSSSGGSF